MDDILVFGKTHKKHDDRLMAGLTRIQAAGATLNRKKCSFGQTKLKFLSHVVDKNGVSADPEKVTAITHHPQLLNYAGL